MTKLIMRFATDEDLDNRIVRGCAGSIQASIQQNLRIDVSSVRGTVRLPKKLEKVQPPIWMRPHPRGIRRVVGQLC